MSRRLVNVGRIFVLLAWFCCGCGDAAEVPVLEKLKDEIARRRGVIDLLDLIKNVDHATGFTGEFTSVGSRTVTEIALRRTRLLFVYRDNLRAAIRTVVNATLDARGTS